MVEKYSIGMAEFQVAHNPCILEIIGLGSCVGIALYDKNCRIGGLAHIMLPKNSDSTKEINPLRFADTSIDATLKEMILRGVKKENIVAKIFGGASMFEKMEHVMHIGRDNVNAVKEKLKKEGIPLVAEEVGGNHGRSIWLDTTNGKVVVSSIHSATREY